MIRTSDKYDRVDWSQPVEWGNPINDGLVARFLAAPGAMGFGAYYGSGWRDCCHRHIGTLVHGGSFPIDWTDEQGRRGGFGAIKMQDNGAVNTTVLPEPSYVGMTMMCWARMDAVAFYPMMMSFGILVDPVPELRFLGSSGTVEFVNRNNNNGIHTGINLAGTGWHHFVGTLTNPGSSAILALFQDSAPTGSNDGSAGEVNAAYLGRGPLVIGNRDGTGFMFPGLIDDVRVYNFALSATQIAAAYEESLRGSPDTLRRVGLKTFSLPPRAGGLLLARRRCA